MDPDKTLREDIPSWMGNIPAAKAYANAVIAGKGDKLLHVIKMTGNNAIYQDCVTDFVRFLHRMHMINTMQMSTEKDAYPQKGCCVHSNVQHLNSMQVKKTPDDYWFYDDGHNPDSEIKMAVFNLSEVNRGEQMVKHLVTQLGLKTSYDELKHFLEDYHGWEEVISEEEFIHNTLIAHYEIHTDDKLNASDFVWITDVLQGKGSDKIARACNQTCICELSEQSVLEAEKENHNSDIPAVRLRSIQEIITPEKNREMEQIADASLETADSQQMDINEGESGAENLPIPELTPGSESIEETPESALEKRRFNDSLAEKMKKLYDNTATQLKAAHDPRWNNFISAYRQAIKNEDYTVQVCKKYLTMTSGDIKSPIYKILYETDLATKQYEKEVRRIKRKTLCFACQGFFYADLTFAHKKEHMTKCPNCGNRLIITIDWLE